MSRPILAPRRPRAMVGVSTASSWPSDDDPMDVTVPGPDPDPEIRKNRMLLTSLLNSSKGGANLDL